MSKKRKLNYFILAGTAGTGKTSVLNYLRSDNFFCVSEMAREVLNDQLAIDGPALPSKNPTHFVQKMMSHCIQGFEKFQKHTSSVFFDRGMPDLIHYAIRFDVEQTEFVSVSKQYLYNMNVFIFPPWEEIFVNDSARRMTFDKSVEFHELLKKVYQELGYNCLAFFSSDFLV